MPPSSSELISAVSHPTRRRILRAVLDDPGGCASTEALATTLEQPVAHVDYHLKTLARYEILRLGDRGDRADAGGHDQGWSLDLEPEWLRLVLDVWAEAALPR
jgi:DNA-binding transcriptional ArsR family regulator